MVGAWQGPVQEGEPGVLGLAWHTVAMQEGTGSGLGTWRPGLSLGPAASLCVASGSRSLVQYPRCVQPGERPADHGS